ncbi:MAG TPA: bifunctional glutamate N-acetyltransferase/amino-acid acetyltransferase ArgJ, partial [Candidatus Acidoferrum sp.]|nr:bifunctional glutamate N-acetyltransferase/amino-acid acetyltransferase ArgJ [Candidatus Acidoferrum sp.]
MKIKFKEIGGSVVAPRGFSAAGVFCDIKRLGTGKGSEKGQKRDLALIVSEAPATVAGMFTTNRICAAPVKLCVARTKKRGARAVVVNSGNANACTGKQGMKDALEMVNFTEQALDLPKGSALVGSTGRIGVVLPMHNVRAGIIEAAVGLGSTAAHANQAAEAIMTSDTRSKQVAVEFRAGGQVIRIGGICKGAGMIQPGMSTTGARPAARPLHATMLCFVTTDAAIGGTALQAALHEAVANSFNRITVDGDMSTNDTVLVLANGQSQVQSPRSKVQSRERSDQKSTINNQKSEGFKAFQAALSHVCLKLAQMIVRDGEGVSRFVTVRVNGARSFAEADAAARAVANSSLVKTSWHGGDPNWGRIIAALGYSAATIVEEKVDIGYSAPGSRKVLWSLRRGQPTRAAFRELCGAVARKEFDLHINLNLGPSAALMY